MTKYTEDNKPTLTGILLVIIIVKTKHSKPKKRTDYVSVYVDFDYIQCIHNLRFYAQFSKNIYQTCFRRHWVLV